MGLREHRRWVAALAGNAHRLAYVLEHTTVCPLRLRSPCHARKRRTLADHLDFLRCFYSFARPQGALKFGKVTRTPAMQAGLEWAAWKPRVNEAPTSYA